MTTCPICHGPMPARSRGKARVSCSYSCNGKRTRAIQMVRDAEVDPAAVWRLTHGDRVTSTHGDRVTATADLTRRGCSLAQVAALLRVTTRSISRYRAEAATRRDTA